MSFCVFRHVSFAAAVVVVVGQLACTRAPEGPTADELFTIARALDAEGRYEEAIVAYGQMIERQPDSFDGHYWIARTMNLAGRYDEARQHFARAIELSSDSNLEQTLRMMGIAWTFVGNADEASRYFTQVFDRRVAAGNPAGAAEVANEIGRLYLELGDLDRADTWYRRGYDTAAEDASRSEAQADLAELRWAHAQARIAARRGLDDEARRHVARVEQLVAKGTNADQEIQLAYLRGYVALYLDDAAAAKEVLQEADQSDPFILLLLARASEQSGDAAAARGYFEQVLESNSHAIAAAIARPIAREWLAAAR